MPAPAILLALRSLRAAPVFTVMALATLALGIGVNTAMFSVLNATLLRALPYPESGQLVRVYRTTTRSQTLPHSPANFLDHQAQNTVFAGLAAASWADFALAEPGHPAERVTGMSVTGDFFTVFGVRPAIGRVLTRDDDQPGRDNVVVLSDTYWRRRFSSDPTIVGRDVRLDGQGVTVVGVMPAGFEDRQLWGTFALVGWLLAGFALLGLFLAAVGIYGVIAGFVGQRVNEIGIRVALGAQARDVLRLVLGQGLRLALAGIALGLVGTYAVARVLGSIAPSLPPAEPTTALAVTAVLIGFALLACWLPARQAVRVDPNVALRAD